MRVTPEQAAAHPVAWAMYASHGRWTPARHLVRLGELALDLFAGRKRRLVISMPPRHGKTEFLCRYLPTWWLGRRPEARVIECSYGEALTVESSRVARDLFAEHAGNVFGVRTYHRASVKAWDVYRPDGRRTGGSLRAVGKGGALTGRGADFLICDDLIRDSQEAGNSTLRQSAWDWFQSVPLTRLEPGGCAVVVMTRWHHDDIVGRLIAQQDRGQAGEAWDVLNLPALAGEGDPLGRPPGEALWPERYPVAELEKIRRDVGPYVWEALYQGRPTPLSGGVFKREWIRYYDLIGDVVRVPGRGESRMVEWRRFATCDLSTSTKTSGDYTAIACWAYHPVHQVLVLLDMLRERIPPPEIVPTLRGLIERWGLVTVWVERAGYQLAALSMIKDAQQEQLPVREIHPEGDKVTRAMPLAAALEGARVFFRAGAPWLGDLEEELLAFPLARGGHDDQVDALAYGAIVASRFRALGTRRPSARDGGEGRWLIGRGD